MLRGETDRLGSDAAPADSSEGVPAPVLDVRSLVKDYAPAPPWLRPLVRTASRETVHALRDVSFAVQPGEIVGLVGPNGAGKTTLIKTVCGLLEPTSGSVFVDSVDVVAQPVLAKRKLGLVLADDRGLYWRLDGQRNLQFFGALAGLTPAAAKDRSSILLEEAGLAHRDRLVFGYSSGMRTRLSIARALLGDPPFLLLDEPTRSLDPVASADVSAYLRGLADRGKSVLLSSHRLDEVSALCDRVVVLVGGTVRYQGPARTDQNSARHIADVLTRESQRT